MLLSSRLTMLLLAVILRIATAHLSHPCRGGDEGDLKLLLKDLDESCFVSYDVCWQSLL